MNLPIELKNNAISKPLHESLTHWRNLAPVACHSSAAGVNALVDSAAAIFEHMQALMHHSTTDEIRQTLTQCLESLQKQYQQLDYSQDISLTAHYLICATLDDIMRHNTKPLFHSSAIMTEPAQFLQSFHQGRLEQEKFYSILEHITTQPEKYIDLLELMYLCLRFGYKGRYRNTPFGLQQWTLLTDNLYHVITETRGEHSDLLSLPIPSCKNNVAILPPAKKRLRFYLAIFSGLALFIIATSFIFKEAYDATYSALDTSATTQQPLETPR